MSDDADSGAISPERLHERLCAGETVTILDVRNRDEFEAWNVEGPSAAATQIPHARFLQAQVRGGAAELVADLAEPIVVVCGRGEASGEVAAQLREAGVDAANLAGGMRGWARVYVAESIPHPEATVRQYARPATGCLSHLVVAGDEAALIDPLAAFTDRYVEDVAAAGATLRYAVDTHVHADHVSGVRELANATGAAAVLPAGTRERGLAFNATLLAAGEDLSLGSLPLTARPLPGHTTEMTGIALGGLWFTGDTVFEDAVARPDLEAGADGAADLAARLYETLQERLLALPPETCLAPGHRESGARAGPTVLGVGELPDRIDALSLDREAFVERILERMPPQPRNYERIVDANLGQQDLDDEEAFEIELGPNNCAAG